MAAFNEFSEITFIDGASPPINAANLNAIEDVLALTDVELARSKSFNLNKYLQYFRKRNQKDINTYYQDSTSYSNGNPGGCTLSNDTTNNIINDQALKMLMASNLVDYLDSSIVLGTALDLTKFLDETASTTDDIILLFFYISDADAITGSSGYIYLNLGNGGIGNTYEYDFDIDAWGFDTGYNVAWIPKSSFYVWAGAPNWNNIDYIQVQIDYNAGYQNEYVTLNLLQMNRHDPDDANYPNPFQKYMGSVSGWENKLIQDYPIWTIVNDTAKKDNKLGILKLNPDNFETPFTPDNYKNGMLIYENVNCFVSKFSWMSKYDDEISTMCFYIDSTHYAYVYYNSATLTLSVANGGAAVDTDWTFDDDLDLNQKIDIFFEKHNDTLRAIAQKNGEIIGICEYESTFSSAGDIYLGANNGVSFGLLVDFAISHSINQLKLLYDNMPVIIRKLEDEIVNNSNTVQNDDDIYAYLAPNKLYKVELFIKSITAGGTSIDLRVAWELTNCSDYGFRHVIGPIVNMSSPYDTTVKIAVELIESTIEYGLNNTKYSNIQETFYVRASETGGKIQMKWAQRTSTAVNTYMKEDTFMIVTPIQAGY